MLFIEQIRPEHTWHMRMRVLYPEQALMEMEMPEDTAGMHFGAYLDGAQVGVVSLFKTGADFQFRKLAVAAAAQHRGIGTQLLSFIIEHARKEGGSRIWCNARLSATGFYLKHGFTETGKAFNRNGVDYREMELRLIPASEYQA